ncbi:uncharacterized protein LY89DRAFT_681782 [Mollisia scopiformis]|uniref:Uncharacterized protein n=1 Tax=Mollisia scopiformis TaxID=149040 RepID=A0A194XM67_MOLSC|nr:uncharacterized protein LY89DRAFT_681782 [Mollisia scopiformis]KUJ21179.1 hypothetical protein LY89DRAFT_681782 [Mollisia scopiformis]
MDSNTNTTTGPTAGYDNNVDQNFGETGKKEGVMSKIKDKLMPSGPGETDTSGIDARNAASHVHHASHGGQERHDQANSDLNRE